MEFRILGPLEVREGGAPVTLGGRRQRALLARLLLEPGRTVAVDQLVDDLWGRRRARLGGQDGPHLRVAAAQAAARGRAADAPPRLRAAIEPGTLDLDRFAALREAGRAALASGATPTAAEQLREALQLWRGAALAEFSEPFARVEASRLEELQLACLEDRIEADIALGRHADVVAELEALVARHPLRERLRGQLMLSLYRSGRQAEALAAYREFRATIDEQLGLEPSLAPARARAPHPAAGPRARRARARDAVHPAGRRADSAPRSHEHGETRFVRSGDVSIAYQVLGEGPMDLVLVHGWVCSFDAGWEREQIARFYRRLAAWAG